MTRFARNTADTYVCEYENGASIWLIKQAAINSDECVRYGWSDYNPDYLVVQFKDRSILGAGGKEVRVLSNTPSVKWMPESLLK